jgi:hypothetical protein
MKKDFSVDKLYGAAYHWAVSYGPRLLIGLAVLDWSASAALKSLLL